MIHLIVGNTGSGKTTYAQALKAQTRGVLFSIDQWNNTLFLPDKKSSDGLEWFLERIDRAEKMILNVVEQLEDAHTDAILDLGLSKFEHREKFRRFADEKGYELKIHFLDIPRAIRLARVLERNNKKGATFQFEVSREDFDFMENWFEAPDETEMKNGVTITH